MILISENTKIIIQGITGTQGSFHAARMFEYGTKIVGGVTPGKGGQKIAGVPVFNSVKEAKGEATWSAIFVPAAAVKAAAFEAIDEDLNLVIITEGVPVWDTLAIVQRAKKKNKKVIGPNCPGIISPGAAKIGIMPGEIFKPGYVGIVSRSGTLTYEIVNALTRQGVGQSTVVGIGGDPVKGLGFKEVLAEFEKDGQTKRIILVGEIGGAAEEEAAKFIKENVAKPVTAYVAGRTAPEGQTMGHAGAVIHGQAGTACTKIEALKAAGVSVAGTYAEMVAKIGG